MFLFRLRTIWKTLDGKFYPTRLITQTLPLLTTICSGRSRMPSLEYGAVLLGWNPQIDTVKVWSERDSFEPGERNVVEGPLVETKNVILLPLNIKLGIVKNFVKAIVRNGNAFGYPKIKIPKT